MTSIALPDSGDSALRGTANAQEILVQIAHLAQHLAGMPLVLVSAPAAAGTSLSAGLGLQPAQTDALLPWCRTLLAPGQAMRTVSDIAQEPSLAQPPLMRGAPHIHCVTCFAIGPPDSALPGILAVLDTQARSLPGATLDALQTLAQHAAALLQQHALAQQVQAHAAMQAALQARTDTLQLSEERLNGMVRAVTDVGWDWDVRKQRVWWSDGQHDFMDAAAPTHPLDISAWTQCVHPQDRFEVEKGLWEALHSQRSHWSAQFRYRHPQGPYQWVLNRAVILRDDSGQALRMVGGFVNIHAQKEAELVAQQDVATHAELLQVQQTLSSMDLALPEVLERVAVAALRASGARGAMVTLIEDSTEEVHACTGPLRACLAALQPLQGQVTWVPLQAGETVLCNDTRAAGWNRSWPSAARALQSVLAVPLRAQHKVVGALTLVSDGANAFGEGDVAQLQALLEALGSLVQLRRMASKLQESEQQYRLLFQSHPQPMWVYAQDDSLRILAVNQAMLAAYGYSEAELLGQAVPLLWPPQETPYRAVPGQCLQAMPTRHQRKDGSLFDVEVSSRCTIFQGQAACQVMASDVTERRRIERDLERVGRARHLLSACNETLMRATSENALLQAICAIVVEIGGYRMAWVGLVQDDAQQSITPVAHVGQNDNFLDSLQLSWSGSHPHGHGMVGTTVRTGQPTIVPDLQASPVYEGDAERIRAHGFQGAICLPLRHGYQIFGVLCLYACEVLQPGSEETHLLQELTNDLAFGIMNLRTRQEQQRVQSTVIKVAAAVSVTTGTEFFIQLARNMADAVGAQVGCVARLLSAPASPSAPPPPPRALSLALVVNGQLQANAEYALEGLPCISLLTQRQHAITHALQEQYPLVHTFCPVQAHSYAGHQLRDSHKKPLGMIFVMFDKPLKNPDFVSSMLQIFAARAAAELERQVADARIRHQASLLDKAQDAILVRDLQHRILFWNQGAERMYGWTQEQAQQQSALALLYEDPEPFQHATAKVLEHGEWVGELVQKHRSGELLEAEVRLTLVRDEHGAPESILSINTDISQRKATERQIQRLAFYDALTGLPNRMLLTDRMHHALAASQRNQQGGALLFIDMDNFKTLNDTLGHDMGDLLLQQVAQRLSSCVRSVDTVARLGGDEFVVVLEALSAEPEPLAQEAREIGEKILAALAVPYKLAHYQYRSTPSIGIAPFLGDQYSVGDLLRHADMAMYQSKASGRNTLRFFDPQMQAVVLARAELETALRTALVESQFLLHYQPQVDHQGQFIGVEAMVRWQHPERGLILPAHFIPLAEETGLILPLGRWVLHVACTLLARWRSSPQLRHLTMAVNVSPRQFRHASFVTDVARILAITGAPAHRLKLELTESLLVEDMETTIATMTTLRDYNVGFSLDDFGTGYSSLSYLKRMPLEQLKVDQSFVRDLLTDPSDAAIVNSIIGLSKGLDLAVIAEGVETLEQRDALLRAGCVFFQGNLFSPPVPHEPLDRLLRQPLTLPPHRPL